MVEAELKNMIRSFINEVDREPPGAPAAGAGSAAGPAAGGPPPAPAPGASRGEGTPPAADRGGKSSQKKGGSAQTSSPVGDLLALLDLLAGKNVMRLTGSAKRENILKGGAYGSTAQNALGALIAARQDVKQAFTDARKGDTKTLIGAALKDIKAAPDDLTKWKGAKVGDVTFEGTPAGLAQFLKFVVIVTSDNVEDGVSNVGLTVPSKEATELADPALKAARIVGALTPYRFLTFTSPTDKFLSGSTITITPGNVDSSPELGAAPAAPQGAITITFPASDSPKTVSMSVAKDADSSGTVKGENADKLVQAGLQGGASFVLKMGDQTYTTSLEVFRPGASIQFAAPRPAARPGPAAEESGGSKFSDFAGDQGGRTVPGKTQSGTATFDMMNIFVTDDGKLSSTMVPVKMTKTAGNRDSFKIEVTAPAPAANRVILVPVSLPAPVREAKHWVSTVLAGQAAPAASGPAVALMPITELTFNFDSNYLTYGTLPKITTIDYVPYDTPFNIAPVEGKTFNVQTSGQLLNRDGVTADTLLTAVRRYLEDDGNPNGGAILNTSPIKRQMNRFPKKVSRG